jgi:hypothetical protein
MVAFGTDDEAVIEYAAAIYLAAQLFFISLIVVVVCVIFQASRRQAKAAGRSMALSSLPAMFAKSTAMGF